jgi:flagellar hook-associated protein 2
MAGLTPLTFSGVSSYSADFQTILKRVVTIASFPLTQLNNERSDVASRRQLTTELNSSVKLLGTQLENIAKVADNRAVTATSSNTAKLSIDSINTDIITNYSITDVTSIARAASETSVASFANSGSTQVSTTGTMKLTVGSSVYDFTLDPGKNNLLGLRDKINSLGAGVTASILTVDGSTNYLSISANGTGAKTLTLKDDPTGANTDFLTSTNQGSNLTFKLNGVTVNRTSNQVNDLVPGVAFTIKDTTTSGETLTVGLSSDRSKLSAAISSFVDAYNALQQKINAQVGEKAGLLSGDILVREAQDIMRRVSSFGVASGTVKGWADLGVTFDSAGTMQFDFSTFNALSETKVRDGFAFLKNDTGLGSLRPIVDRFTDAVTGLADLQLAQFDRTDKRLSEQIAKLEDRISILQASYQAKLQQADTLLASFESQGKVIGAAVESLNLVLFGKKS